MNGLTPSDSRLSTRDLVLLGMLGTLTFVLKMALAQFMNVEPVSLMVMLLAVCFGWKGLYAVYLYVFLEFAVWGFGLWNVAYLYIWLLLFTAAWLLRKLESAMVWAVLSGCFGLLFGGLCALVYWVVGGWGFAVSWWVSGIPADLLHGGANFLIALTLFRPLRRVIERLQKRRV